MLGWASAHSWALPSRDSTVIGTLVEVKYHLPPILTSSVTPWVTMTIPEIYQKVQPSVVLITCEVPATTSGYGGFYGFGQQQQQQTQTATGSGVILTADGYIITNNHVVEDASKITVTLWDGTEYAATVTGADANTDIAVIKIGATGLTAAEFGDSDQLITGELACVVGNPLGESFSDTLTVGYISATERTLTIENTMLKTAKAKFDETVEIHIKLGVDSRHADQQVRGAIVLPNGTGKKIRVLVFAKGDKAKEAEAAGADYVGAEDMVQKIQAENFFDFEVVIATPDMTPKDGVHSPSTATPAQASSWARKATRRSPRCDRAAITRAQSSPGSSRGNSMKPRWKAVTS